MPEWVEAAVVGGNQQVPSAPSGSTCNRHDSWTSRAQTQVGLRHPRDCTGNVRTSRPGTALLRCRVAGVGNPVGRSTNTNTSPPGGSVCGVHRHEHRPEPVPRIGTALRLVDWSRASHDHTPVTTVTPHRPSRTRARTTTTRRRGPSNPVWSPGSCSYDFTVGTSAVFARRLPTYSDSRVSGYSYSGTPPAGYVHVGIVVADAGSGRPSSIYGHVGGVEGDYHSVDLGRRR